MVEAKVYLAKQGGEALGVTGSTDLDGSCTLVLPEGEIFGIVSHRNGKRAGIRVEEGDEPQLIEVEASGSITMLVELDGLPFPGAICAIGDPQVRRLIGDPGEADAEGRITWSGLHPGRYFVDVTHPSLERVWQELDVGPGEAVDFQARVKRK